MPRLIRVFAGHTDHCVCFVILRLKCTTADSVFLSVVGSVRCFRVYRKKNELTHINLESLFGDLGKRIDPDQTLQNAASDQGLHYLHIRISIKNTIEIKQVHQPPLKSERHPSMIQLK